MPAWYLDRLTAALAGGFITVPNPFSGRESLVDLSPEAVHTLVLWSKNFGPFLRRRAAFAAYRLYFLFTVNEMPELEPGVPPLAERLAQAEELARVYGPDRIAWRFDPVVFTPAGPLTSADTFRRIGDHMARVGIGRAIFSFLDRYGKVARRMAARSLNVADPSPEAAVAYAAELAEAAAGRGITLESCCEEVSAVPGILRRGCIDGRLLGDLAGEPAPVARDRGQREACRCTVSRDIGSYADMPCPGGCLYCYANPVIGPDTGGRRRPCAAS